MLHGACAFGFGLVLVFGSSLAWAGRGWYFLIPPVYGERDALEVARTAPLRQWEQGGAFDSAGECEAARVKVVDSARAALASGGEIPQLSPSPRPTSWASDKALRLIYERIAAIDGRCIASDDPRLMQSAPAQRPSEPPMGLSPTTPELNDAVTACRSIVRQVTNREFAQYNSQDANLNSQDGLNVPMMESKFDAYALPDGRLRAVGTQTEYVSFSKCMNDRGYPIEQR